MKVKHLQNAGIVFFLLPFFLYEDFLLSVILSVIGLAIIYAEKISQEFMKLEWRAYLLFFYIFHMLFGERAFGYVGFEPLSVTAIVWGLLILPYRSAALSF